MFPLHLAQLPLQLLIQQYRKSVWPPAEKVADQADVIPEGISAEEVTNQRAYGSHASNSKGRIVHLKNCEFQ